MKIYIVRHGQTKSNVGNKLLGLVDEDIKKVAERKIIKSLSYWVKQQEYQENKKVAYRFKNEAINYLDNNIPAW